MKTTLRVAMVTLGIFQAREFPLCAQQTNAPVTAATNNAGGDVAEGTLAYHLSTNAVEHAKGHTGTADDMMMLNHWEYGYYATNLALLTNSVWSTNFWLHGVRGLSATALGYSNGMGGQTLLTMVSPRHYLFSTHVHPEDHLIAFLDTNDVIYWRKTLGRADLSNDTSVGILNADLPASVGFLPVAPSNFLSYVPTNRTTFVQGIGMNQSKWLYSQPMGFGNPGFVVWNSGGIIPFGLGTNWGVTVRGGDSSNPEMLLIGEQLVLVSHIYGVPVGPNYASQIDGINEKMHYLSTNSGVRTDYQLTQFPLTNWPAIH